MPTFQNVTLDAVGSSADARGIWRSDDLTGSFGAGFYLDDGHYENFVPWPSTDYGLQTATDTFDYALYPRPDSETDANARHRWAHDQMIYEVPIYARGGGFNYQASIDTARTDVALLPYITVTNNWTNRTGAPSCYVRITAAGIQTLAKDGTEYDIYIKLLEQAGKQLKFWWSFKVEVAEGDHFLFFDNSFVGTGAGTWAAPFTDLLDTDAAATNVLAGTGVNSAGMIAVIKEGNSQTTNYTKSSDWSLQTDAFPIAIINNPADTNRPIIDLANTYVLFILEGVGFQNDIFIWGMILENGQVGAETDGYGAFNRIFGGDHKRLVWGNCLLDGVTSWPGVGTENTGVITLVATGSDKEHIVISDIEITNIVASNRSTNTGVALMLMGTSKALFDNWLISNFATGTDTAPELASIKHNIGKASFRRWTAIDNVRSYRMITNDQATEPNSSVDLELCYLNLQRVDGQFNLSFLQAGASALHDGPGYMYRNTIRDGQQVCNWDVPVTIKGNISSVANNFSGTDMTITQPNYDDAVSGDFDAGNIMTDAWYTANGETRGTIGHEIE